MKKILLTTDLSNEARAAFPQAKELATAFNAHIEILTVIEDISRAAVLFAMDFPIAPSKEIKDQYIEKVQLDLEATANEEFSGLETNCTILEATGAVHHTIHKHALAVNADLIVISTHGQAGLTRLLIGSVAERVVRQSPCPVLTVPFKVNR